VITGVVTDGDAIGIADNCNSLNNFQEQNKLEEGKCTQET